MAANEDAADQTGGVSEVVVAEVKRRIGLWLLGLVSWPVIAILLTIFALSVFALSSAPSGSLNIAPSSYAQNLIPPAMLALYRSDTVKNECPALSWTIVAAIIHLESDDNRNPAPSSAGAIGPSQFEPYTWDSQGRLVITFKDAKGNLQPFGRVADGAGYALDGDGDGIADIMDPYDSVPATTRMLCANGGGNPSTLVQAIYAYNHADWYVYGGVDNNGNYFPGVLPTADELAGGYAGTGQTGPVIIAAGANLPGQPITPETMSFLQEVAGIYGQPLICTVGTNHSFLTVDGLVSDHASGHACDFGMAANGGTDDGPVGDAIATACLIAAGDPPDVAAQEAALGGLYTRVYGGLRIQCIWKTDQGGNHHNHVHIGARID